MWWKASGATAPQRRTNKVDVFPHNFDLNTTKTKKETSKHNLFLAAKVNNIEPEPHRHLRRPF